MMDSIKLWLRKTFASVFSTPEGVAKFKVLRTSDEVPENASTMDKVFMILGTVVPLGFVAVLLYYLYKYLVKSKPRRKVRRRTNIVSRTVSRVKRAVGGSGAGSMAMRRRMAKVRAARRKKSGTVRRKRK